ncbi:galactose-specific lectin nattectin-like [Synchiropus picturatus]
MKTHGAVFVLLCCIVGLSAASEEFCKNSAKCKQVDRCPPSWSFYNGRCFYVERTEMNWTEAQANCQSMGGNLASIENVFDYRQIQELIRNGTNNLPLSWVGGNNREETSIWRWTDGREITFSEWCPGEPNSQISNQHCLQINYLSEKCWDDDFCKFHKVSVCDAVAAYGSSATLNIVHQLDVLLSLFAIFFSDMF